MATKVQFTRRKRELGDRCVSWRFTTRSVIVHDNFRYARFPVPIPEIAPNCLLIYNLLVGDKPPRTPVNQTEVEKSFWLDLPQFANNRSRILNFHQWVRMPMNGPPLFAFATEYGGDAEVNLNCSLYACQLNSLVFEVDTASEIRADN